MIGDNLCQVEIMFGKSLMLGVMLLCANLLLASCAETNSTTAAPLPTEPVIPKRATAQVELARDDLTTRLDIAADTIRLVALEAVEWSDTSLGCPQFGKSYAKVIVPGFRITLKNRNTLYIYHSTSTRFVLCKQTAAQ